MKIRGLLAAGSILIMGAFHAETAKAEETLKTLSFESFQNLSAEKMDAYVTEIRNFFADQEAHWQGANLPPGTSGKKSKKTEADFFFKFKKLFELIDFDSASAAETRCTYTEEQTKDLSDAQKWLLKNGRNVCLMGGSLVCLVASSEGLKCTANNNDDFKKMAKSKGCPEGFIYCKGPAYSIFDSATKKGSFGFCASGYQKGSVSKFCAKHSAKTDQIKKLIDEKPIEAKAAYDEQMAVLKAYCGDKGELAHAFDKGDCTALQARLEEIEPAVNGVKSKVGKFLCNDFQNIYGKKNDQSLLLKLYAVDEKHFKVEKYGSEAENWTRTQCDNLGFVESKFIDKRGQIIQVGTVSDCGYTFCLARRDLEKKTTEVLRYPFSSCEITSLNSCQLSHIVYRDAASSDGSCHTGLDTRSTNEIYSHENGKEEAVLSVSSNRGAKDIPLNQMDKYGKNQEFIDYFSSAGGDLHGLVVSPGNCRAYFRNSPKQRPGPVADSSPLKNNASDR